MIQGALAVYYREMLIMRRRGLRLLAGMAVSPVLYFVTFSQAIGRSVQLEGISYTSFLLPGLAAMTSMMQAYAMASEINTARFYFRMFDEFQASPVGSTGYVLGEVLTGITRGLSAALVIVVIGWLFGVAFQVGALFWLGCALNAFCFASLAVALAMVVRSHADQAMLTNFIITPMAFLGGTFFSVNSLPGWASTLLNILPLTQASHVIRQASLGMPVDLYRLVLLAGLGLVCFALAVYITGKAQD
jgi:ABC-type multidrug transport system permease subunit